MPIWSDQLYLEIGYICTDTHMYVDELDQTLYLHLHQ